MKNLKVKLKKNSYDIIVSSDINDFVSNLKKHTEKASKIFVITDTNIKKIYLKRFCEILKKEKIDHSVGVIEAGEKGKTIVSLDYLYNRALKEGIDRKSYVIAFGGGVVGDIAGFFAATYMRGINFVQVPTTLLAMTDSSVGGKTAINIKGGKNIAGAFYQPSFVWINSKFLSTLEERHIRNGFAEIIKYGIAFDREFFDYIFDLLNEGIILEENFDYLIYQSCKYKAAIVEKDEKETVGIRELLNCGHTFAHALETYTKYEKYLHGEAVAAGLLFTAYLSVKLKYCKQEVYIKVKELLQKAGLIFNLSKINASKIVELMKKDKKSVNGNIRFVLLKDIGKSISGYEVKDTVVKKHLLNFIKENK